MSKPLAISPDDLLRVLEKMGYRCCERTIDTINIVIEKADEIAIPIKEVIALEKIGYRCCERTIDAVNIVVEKADKISISIKEVIGEKRVEEICEILEVPVGHFISLLLEGGGSL